MNINSVLPYSRLLGVATSKTLKWSSLVLSLSTVKVVVGMDIQHTDAHVEIPPLHKSVLDTNNAIEKRVGAV